ncbi:MAG: hypothetical protein HUU41_21790 [Bryobacteraceae bacterium]|nr:hypothetical protein [Bryobacterales bacterium]MEB2362088.1 hypothetical protein [Bryobacterales bacterium]NUN03748.1 hypothetical protein [Bryobacteraceae bacterium]
MPPNSSPDAVVQRLTILRNGLLALHKSLLDSERDSYEKDIGRITSSGQFLNLVLHDPWFAWLRELSELIVLIDESLAAEQPPVMGDAERFFFQVRSLVAPDENGSGFRKNYFDAMQRDPAIVLAHRDMTRLLELAGKRELR